VRWMAKIIIENLAARTRDVADKPRLRRSAAGDNTGNPTRRHQRSIRPRTAAPSRGLDCDSGTCSAAIVVSCDHGWHPRRAGSNVDANGVLECPIH
jgi:hypothetical protein